MAPGGLGPLSLALPTVTALAPPLPQGANRDKPAREPLSTLQDGANWVEPKVSHGLSSGPSPKLVSVPPTATAAKQDPPPRIVQCIAVDG